MARLARSAVATGAGEGGAGRQEVEERTPGATGAVASADGTTIEGGGVGDAQPVQSAATSEDRERRGILHPGYRGPDA